MQVHQKNDADEILKQNSIHNNADIIFIHGYGGSRCSWSLIDAGVQSFSTPVYLELVGFGKHKPPAGFDFSIEAQAKHLSETLRVMNTGATLVAHSMGAAVLLVAILDHGLKTNRIILVDPLAYQQSLPFFIKFQAVPLISSFASHVLPPSFQIDLVLKATYADPDNINKGVRQCYIDEFETPFHRRTLSRTAHELASFIAEPYVSRYRDVAAEVHLVWGTDDPLISSELSSRLARDLNAFSVRKIPNCGHAPHEECPNEFVDAIRAIMIKQ